MIKLWPVFWLSLPCAYNSRRASRPLLIFFWSCLLELSPTVWIKQSLATIWKLGLSLSVSHLSVSSSLPSHSLDNLLHKIQDFLPDSPHVICSVLQISLLIWVDFLLIYYISKLKLIIFYFLATPVDSGNILLRYHLLEF